MRTLGLTLLLAACAEEGVQKEWVAFNADGDAIDVDVTDGEVGPAVTADLLSTSGEVVIGTITVDPGSGPVGTEHLVRVDIGEDYAEAVGRVDIDADSGDRGVWTIALDQDSAEASLWVRRVRSFGVEGETREDAFYAHLYELVEVEPEAEVQQ